MHTLSSTNTANTALTCIDIDNEKAIGVFILTCNVKVTNKQKNKQTLVFTKNIFYFFFQTQVKYFTEH